jgi:hypothetical protein
MSNATNVSRFSSLQGSAGDLAEEAVAPPPPTNPFLGKAGAKHGSSRWEGLRPDPTLGDEGEEDGFGMSQRRENVFSKPRASKACFRRRAPKKAPVKAFCLETAQKSDDFPSLGKA